jgi:hypothetical protein
MAAFKKAQSAQAGDGVIKKLEYRIGNQ